MGRTEYRNRYIDAAKAKLSLLINEIDADERPAEDMVLRQARFDLIQATSPSPDETLADLGYRRERSDQPREEI
jgi:hypothetical protein